MVFDGDGYVWFGNVGLDLGCLEEEVMVSILLVEEVSVSVILFRELLKVSFNVWWVNGK